MTETVHFAKILIDDLDLGNGTRSIRLADGSLHTLTRIPGHVYIASTVTVSATSSASQLTATFPNPAGARVHGVTTKITTGLGTSNGLTAFDIGDAVLSDRWGQQATITINQETDGSDFNDADEPIVSANYAALLTAVGGTFDGTGEIEVQLHWSIIKHR